MCAKKVVALLQSMESQLQRERQRKMAEEQAAAAERVRMEEAERERLRQEKRAAKERRREEQKMREEDRKREVEEQHQHEMQINNSVNNMDKRAMGDAANGHTRQQPIMDPPTRGWCYSLFMFLMGMSVVGVALAISLIWIYTEGKLDSASIQIALPVIQSDVEDYFLTIGQKTVKAADQAAKTAQPYIDSGIERGSKAWREGGKSLRHAAKYVEKNYGETFSRACEHVKQAAGFLWSRLLIVWSVISPHLHAGWEWAKPHFHQLGKVIIETSLTGLEWLRGVAPVYVEWATDLVTRAAQWTVESWNQVTKGF